MPGPNRAQIGKLIRDVTNTKLSMKVREKKLTELEKSVNEELSYSKQNFDAIAKEFNEKLSAYEAHFDDFFDTITPTVDSAEVDELIAQVRDEARLEQMLTAEGQQKEAALMNRLRTLKGTLSSSSSASKKSTTQQDNKPTFLEPLSDEAYKRHLDFTGLEAGNTANPKDDLKKDKQKLADLETTADDMADLDVLSAEQLEEMLTDAETITEYTTDLENTSNAGSEEPENQGLQIDETENFADAEILADSDKPSQPAAPSQSEQPPVAMSSLPDTPRREQSTAPREITSLPDQVQAKPESSVRATDKLSIKEQLDQITKQLSPEEQKVLKSMSSGRNDNYALELATLIQQRENISTKAKAADQKETPQDEDIAAKLQAEELDTIFQPKSQ